jgi:sec-independent protein translocase protein TatB
MFEVGFTEILLIFGIALLVLGPERLPKLAADVGRWAGRARAMARQLRTQLEQEVQFDPLADTQSSSSSTGPTIHSPAPAASASATADTTRAAPAQLAEHVAPPMSSSPDSAGSGADWPTPDPSFPDAMLQPEPTPDDRKPA